MSDKINVFAPIILPYVDFGCRKPCKAGCLKKEELGQTNPNFSIFLRILSLKVDIFPKRLIQTQTNSPL